MSITGSYIVSFSFSDDSTGVCVVGKQVKGTMKIINAFQNEEARAIFDKLTTSTKGATKDEQN